MPRLFTAISLPDPIADGLLPLMSGLRGARWVARGDLHITLRFIGDVDEPMANDIVEALDGLTAAPFEVCLSGLGAFGGKAPRSVYAALAASPALHALHAAQERLMQETGLSPERRKYTPHVTLARLRRVNADAVATWLGDNGGYSGSPWMVDEYHLMSARDSTGGGPYIPVVSFPLAPKT